MPCKVDIHKMNDFTKDELCILIKCIRLTEIDYGECADLDKVKFKIQKMIHSYKCRNESSEKLNEIEKG
jgi:hypothetical protein